MQGSWLSPNMLFTMSKIMLSVLERDKFQKRVSFIRHLRMCWVVALWAELLSTIIVTRDDFLKANCREMYYMVTISSSEGI